MTYSKNITVDLNTATVLLTDADHGTMVRIPVAAVGFNRDVTADWTYPTTEGVETHEGCESEVQRDGDRLMVVRTGLTADRHSVIANLADVRRAIAHARAEEQAEAEAEQAERAEAEPRCLAIYGMTGAQLNKLIERAERGLTGDNARRDAVGFKAMSIMSDAQELMERGRTEEARQAINVAKYLVDHATADPRS